MVLFASGFVELGRTPVQHSAFPCPLRKPVSLNPVSIHTTNNISTFSFSISTFSFSQKSFRSGGLYGDEPRPDW